jgi:hypothetical protein
LLLSPETDKLEIARLVAELKSCHDTSVLHLRELTKLRHELDDMRSTVGSQAEAVLCNDVRLVQQTELIGTLKGRLRNQVETTNQFLKELNGVNPLDASSSPSRSALSLGWQGLHWLGYAHRRTSARRSRIIAATVTKFQNPPESQPRKSFFLESRQ